MKGFLNKTLLFHKTDLNQKHIRKYLLLHTGLSRPYGFCILLYLKKKKKYENQVFGYNFKSKYDI